MNTAGAAASGNPKLRFEIVLGRPFGAKLGEEAISSLHLRQRLKASLSGLCAEIGSPAEPEVQISRSSCTVPVSVYVGGAALRCPEGIFFQIADYLNPDIVAALPDLPEPEDVLAQDVSTNWQPGSGAAAFVTGLLSHLVSEIVWRRPDCLLPQEPGAAQDPAGEGAHEEKAFSRRALSITRQVAELGIPLTEGSFIRETIRAMAAAGISDEEVAESLTAVLRPGSVRVHVHPEYGAALIDAAGQDGSGLSTGETSRLGDVLRGWLDYLRDAMFHTLGVRVPEIDFVPAPDLKEQSFAVQIGCFRGAPCRGLASCETLVNERPSRLRKLGITATARWCPANTAVSMYSVVTREDVHRLPAGLTSWTAPQYLIMVIAKEVRSHAQRMVDRDLIRWELELLRGPCPDLVEAVSETFSVVDLTRVLRLLVSEGVMIRDLPAILGAMLRCRHNAGLTGADAETPREPSRYVQEVREDLRRYLTYNSADATGSTVTVVLLDPAVEARLRRHLDGDPLTEAEREKVRAAVRGAFRRFRGYALPAILTAAEIRPVVREMLAMEFPELKVLSYRELAPSSWIQTVARIPPEAD